MNNLIIIPGRISGFSDLTVLLLYLPLVLALNQRKSGYLVQMFD